MEKFHSISGDSIPEHNKQFQLFLRDLKQLPEEEVGKFIACLTSKNRQEENFRVKIAIELGSSSDILRILKEGDQISTRILLKNIKNINTIFNDVNGNDLINNVCPYLSYVTRNRLLIKLAFNIIDVNKGREYFNSVYSKYGIKTAKSLLVACSEEFVRVNVAQFKPTFNQRELIKLHIKSNTFLRFYFAATNRSFSNCDLLGRFLAVNDVHVFKMLLEYGSPDIGKRGVVNVIKNYKNEIIADPNKYKSVLKVGLLKRHLSESEFKMLFKNLFNKNVDCFRFNDDMKRCLEKFPKCQRYVVFCATYKLVYSIDFENDKCRLPLNLFEIADQRKITPNIGEYNIDLIKEKINLTNEIRNREKLVLQMLETCRLYNDLEKLLEVLKYFIFRHKNDNYELRANFLIELSEKFPLDTLTDDHWLILLDLLKIFEVHSEYFSAKTNFFAARLLWKLKHKLDHIEDFKKFLLSGNTVIVDQIHPDYEQMLILQCPDILEEIFPIEPEPAMLQFINTISAWNEKYPKKQISYFKYPNYIQKILKYLIKIEQLKWYSSTMKKIIFFEPVLQEEISLKEEFVIYFLNDCDVLIDDEIAMWLLRYKPNLFSKHVDEIILQIHNKAVFYTISKMHYHEIYKKFRKCAINRLNDTLTRSNIFKFFSYEKDFLEIIEKYKANNIKFNREDANETLGLQISILGNLKNSSNHENNLTVILDYCKKDYLRYALETLYYVLFHTREISITAPIAEISKRSVSVRKHAVYLTTTLGSTQLILTTLTNMIEKEKNSSVRQFMLKNTFRSLIKECNDDLWQLLKAQIRSLKPNDGESINLLSIVKSIPIKFCSDYFLEFWHYLKKCDDDKQLILLQLLDADLINLLDNNFCVEIIQSTIGKPDWSHLACIYLFSKQSDNANRQKIIFDCITQKSITNMQTIYSLINSICSKLLDKPEGAIEFIVLLRENLQKLFLPYNKFALELLIQTTHLYLENEKTLQNLAAMFVKQQFDLIGKFGAEVFNYHIDFLSDFFGMVIWKFDGDNQMLYLEFCSILLATSDSDHVKLLVMRLLPTDKSNDVDFKRKRSAVIDKLRKNCTPLIDIYLTKLKHDSDLD